jgi:hypothetical protein
VGVDVATAVGEDGPCADAYDQLGAGEVGDQRIGGIDGRLAVDPQPEPSAKSMNSRPTSRFSVTLPMVRNMPLPS